METGNNDEDEHATDSSSDSNSDFPTRKRRKSKKRKKRLAMHKDEVSAANVAVLNVTCWILRIPVLCMDFIRYVYFLRLYMRDADSQTTALSTCTFCHISTRSCTYLQI